MLVTALLLALSTVESYGSSSPTARCQALRNKAVGKYAACRHSAEAQLAATGNAAFYAQKLLRCEYKLASAWAATQAKAAAAGVTCLDAPLTESDFKAALDAATTNVAVALAGNGLTQCASSPTATPMVPTPTPTPGGRFIDNGDGTVTDSQTSLQWEKKDTVCPGMHCVSDAYRWSATFPQPDGTAFTVFLATLNASSFAGHNDWRLPTSSELRAILLDDCLVHLNSCTCPQGAMGCIDPAFGPTAQSYYWSETTASGENWAWSVGFFDGYPFQDGKDRSFPVRAVRDP